MHGLCEATQSKSKSKSKGRRPTIISSSITSLLMAAAALGALLPLVVAAVALAILKGFEGDLLLSAAALSYGVGCFAATGATRQRLNRSKFSSYSLACTCIRLKSEEKR